MEILTTEKTKELIQEAKHAMGRAYAPYSNFAVGSALLTEDGHIFAGCNVENVSYGLTNCAERTAIFKAVSEGHRQFLAIAIYADIPNFCSPCGACRQVIAEFGRDIKVIRANNKGEYVIDSIEALLPGGFSAADLKGDTR